jgi:hypothetical protein
MQLTHSSYDVNTNVQHTLLPSIRNIRTYVNTGSGIAAKGIKIYCPKYERVWTVWQGVPGSYEYLHVKFAETKNLILSNLRS